ncbi:MAG: hypothetical protein SWK76_05955 [Actinomycetota bacterium]|nr:hypothetical protein [Actinomycetota bacterium]
MLITTMAVIAAIVVGVLVVFLMSTPQQVEVKDGTVVWDPIDGHIWEDNTRTMWVNSNETSNYSVEYIVKYSPEHEEQLKLLQDEELAERGQVEESQGLESISTAVPTQYLKDLETAQNNLGIMGQDIITGLDMANMLEDFKSSLQYWRNQIAATPAIPEVENYKQQALSAMDKAITAIDLYLQGISTANPGYFEQANALLQEAAVIIQDLSDIIKTLAPATEELQNMLQAIQ